MKDLEYLIYLNQVVVTGFSTYDAVSIMIHSAIVKALFLRDCAKARQEMRRHIECSGKVMITHLKKLDTL